MTRCCLSWCKCR